MKFVRVYFAVKDPCCEHHGPVGYAWPSSVYCCCQSSHWTST